MMILENEKKIKEEQRKRQKKKTKKTFEKGKRIIKIHR